MTVSIEQRRRIRAARRLLQVHPDTTVAERMALAADILTGKAAVDGAAKDVSRGNAMAARVKRAITGEPAPEEEREETGGHDRKKRGGRNRSA